MNMKRLINISLVLAASMGMFWLSCGTHSHDHGEETVAETNTFTPEEGFTVLFDGSSLDAWKNYNVDTLSHKWAIEDGTMSLAEKGAGDIVTRKEYENFDLRLEWKISKNGNSGIFFHILENDSIDRTYRSAPEMQILDNDGHKDGKIITHRAGDNYDMQSCSEETVRPVGEWNEVRLVVNQGKVEHWLNGKMVVAYEIGSEEWNAQLAKSKFADWPYYAKAGKGLIGLQDHGDPVWFRNVRVKEL